MLRRIALEYLLYEESGATCWDTMIDVRKRPDCFSMCPACALTCQCAKCSRRLLTLAAKYAGVPVPAAAKVPARGGGEVGANYASTRGGLSRAAKSAALQRGYANSDWSIEASMGDAHDGRRGASAHERVRARVSVSECVQTP